MIFYGYILEADARLGKMRMIVSGIFNFTIGVSGVFILAMAGKTLLFMMCA